MTEAVRQKKIANLVDGPSFSRFPYEVGSPSNAFQSPSSTTAFTRPVNVNGANSAKSSASDEAEKPQKSKSSRSGGGAGSGGGGLPHSSSSSDLETETKRSSAEEEVASPKNSSGKDFPDFEANNESDNEESDEVNNEQSPKGIRGKKGRTDSEDIDVEMENTEDKEVEVEVNNNNNNNRNGPTTTPPMSSADLPKSVVLTPPLHPAPPMATAFKTPPTNKQKKKEDKKSRTRSSKHSKSSSASSGPKSPVSFPSPTPATPFSEKVPFGAETFPNMNSINMNNNAPIAPRHQVHPSNSITPMSTYTSIEFSKHDLGRQQSNGDPLSPADIQFQKVDVPSVPDLPRVSPLTNQIQKTGPANFRGFGSDSAYEEMEESYSRSQPQYQKVTVYLPGEDEEMIQLTVRRTCSAILLVRAVLEQYRKERALARRPLHPDMQLDLTSYRLFMAEEDGTVDTEFPALDDRCEIASTGAEAFALRKKRNDADGEKSEKKEKPREKEKEREREKVKEKLRENGGKPKEKKNSQKSNLRPMSVSDSDAHIGEGEGRDHSKRERLSSDIYTTDLPKAHPERKSSFADKFLCCCFKPQQE